MARNRKEKAKEERIKLRQPDRSGPTGKTLLDLANERDLFQQADWRQRELELARQRAEDDKLKLPPGAERFLEALLYSATLAVVHFSFDVLVMRQYGPEVKWDKAFHNAPRAFIGTPNLLIHLLLEPSANGFKSSSSSSTRYMPTNPTRRSCPACRDDSSGRSASCSSSA